MAINMKKRCFKITMKVPLGIRCGTLTFEDNEGVLNGTLTLFGKTETLVGVIAPDGTVQLNGTMSSLLRTFSYTAQGHINGSKIELEVIGERNRFHLWGEEEEI